MLDRADEIVISDLTPEALATRMQRGDIYPMQRVEQALSNFFRRGNLIALREMALQRVAKAVDRTLEDYVNRKHLGSHWTVAEKVAVCISANPIARDLIARGAKLAKGLDAEFFVLHLDTERDHEPDVAMATAEFATKHRITQAIFGRSASDGLKKYLYFHAILQFTTVAPHVDVHIITQETS